MVPQLVHKLLSMAAKWGYRTTAQGPMFVMLTLTSVFSIIKLIRNGPLKWRRLISRPVLYRSHLGLFGTERLDRTMHAQDFFFTATMRSLLLGNPSTTLLFHPPSVVPTYCILLGNIWIGEYFKHDASSCPLSTFYHHICMAFLY